VIVNMWCLSDDSNACTEDSCDTENGCVNSPISCDNSNMCTNDCVYCHTGSDCVTDSCDPEVGC